MASFEHLAVGMAMRSTLKNGLEAALMLAVVMGFGRFAYTALYPYMVNEQILGNEQGSWAAAAKSRLSHRSNMGNTHQA